LTTHTGWMPLNPAANFNPEVLSKLASGGEVLLPNLGMGTLHHMHATDVALAFACALACRTVAIGESFHVVSPAALTLRGFAEQMAAWFGQAPNIRFLPWEEWRQNHSEKDARITWDHIARSPNCCIEKARRLLGYEPRYESLEAIQESVAWLVRGLSVTVRRRCQNASPHPHTRKTGAYFPAPPPRTIRGGPKLPPKTETSPQHALFSVG
jgi:nucleoside-diphosphate-sugar epimerase